MARRRGRLHDDIRDCPLYIAAHDPNSGGNSCDDGRLDEGGCAVDRGLDYFKARRALAAHLATAPAGRTVH